MRAHAERQPRQRERHPAARSAEAGGHHGNARGWPRRAVPRVLTLRGAPDCDAGQVPRSRVTAGAASGASQRQQRPRQAGSRWWLRWRGRR